MSKISVIITCHNYGRYLKQAVQSVVNQTFDDWEAVVVDDGSTDDTPEVMKIFEGNPKIRCLRLPGLGLARAANAGIRASEGEYVIRLDADDYFDENILLVLSNVLDRHPEYGMVYPDFYQVTKHGAVIDCVRQPKINDEVKLLDRSALAAGALYRRRCYDAVGGYNEELTRQEDYDYWIRFIDRFHIYNVQLPLMYYRKHSSSMSVNPDIRARARRYVKRKFVTQDRDAADRSVLCVLPMIAENSYRWRLPLEKLGGRLLMEYVIEEAKKVGAFDRIVVDTEDEEIAHHARELGVETPFIRPRHLSRIQVSRGDVLRHLLTRLHREEHYDPDVVVMAYYNHPFIRAPHLEEALNTLLIHDCDSVISVTADTKFHWRPGEHGLAPLAFPRQGINDQMLTVYEERGGIFAMKSDNFKSDHFLGRWISHIEVDEKEALRVDSTFHHWVAERMLAEGILPNPEPFCGPPVKRPTNVAG